MSRIFSSLIAANLILFFIAGALGVFNFLNRSTSPDRHVLLAVLTLLLSCLIQVGGFTYLTITGKVIAQAVHVGKLDQAAIASAKLLKRRFTHQLALTFSAIILATASGASAWRSGNPSVFHALMAGLTIVTHALAWRNEFRLIRANELLVASTLAAYKPAT
jgi:hypothetical protein